jgi:hypothetical protein
MVHWKGFLLGPPNKPNQDEYGLLAIIVKVRPCLYI